MLNKMTELYDDVTKVMDGRENEETEELQSGFPLVIPKLELDSQSNQQVEIIPPSHLSMDPMDPLPAEYNRLWCFNNKIDAGEGPSELQNVSLALERDGQSTEQEINSPPLLAMDLSLSGPVPNDRASSSNGDAELCLRPGSVSSNSITPNECLAPQLLVTNNDVRAIGPKRLLPYPATRRERRDNKEKIRLTKLALAKAEEKYGRKIRKKNTGKKNLGCCSSELDNNPDSLTSTPHTTTDSVAGELPLELGIKVKEEPMDLAEGMESTAGTAMQTSEEPKFLAFPPHTIDGSVAGGRVLGEVIFKEEPIDTYCADVMETSAGTVMQISGESEIMINSTVISSSNFQLSTIEGEHEALADTSLVDPVSSRSAEGNEQFTCHLKLCPKKFKSMCNLKSHIRNVHDKKYKYVCPFDGCTQGCPQVRDLRGHFANVHRMIKEFFCHVCPKEFGLERNLKQHIRRCHFHKKPKGPARPVPRLTPGPRKTPVSRQTGASRRAPARQPPTRAKNPTRAQTRTLAAFVIRVRALFVARAKSLRHAQAMVRALSLAVALDVALAEKRQSRFEELAMLCTTTG